MDKSEFQDLLWRYQRDLCSEEEKNRIHLWFSELNESSDLDITPEEKESVKLSIQEKIIQNVENLDGVVTPLPQKRSLGKWVGIAASILTISASLYFLYSPQKTKETLKEEFELVAITEGTDSVFKQNTGTKLLKIKLEDGSKITLLPKSSITVLTAAGENKREVNLEGNAFFDIEPDSTRPFFIYHGNLVTQVLGTSFWIKNNVISKKQEVEVVTGVVRLSERNTPKIEKAQKLEIILASNQKATYIEELRNLSHSEKIIAPLEMPDPQVTEQRIYFQNSNLGEIAETLASEFNTEIIFASENLSQCAFTGDVSNLPLNPIMDLICKSIKTIHYETIGNRIVLYGDGCNQTL